MISDNLATLKDQLILRQQKQISELKAANQRLESYNTELKKILIIALQDSTAPIVVNRKRFDESRGEFELSENIDGDLLIRVRRQS